MTQEVQAWKKNRRRLWVGLALLLALLAVVVMPSLISMNRYKSRITQLLSESLGRPVRLSSVELRLLPVPGFVLTDLTVQEDPAYGAEPVLHANTVTASIRLLSLLSGQVRIGTISVDEASLNVVRTLDGKWNLDPLFRTAAAKSQPAARAGGRAMPLPYLQATNSRINFKRGAEKLPFSLVETDLSFWQEQPGDWRIRLRGQPARTDVSLDLADTGIVRLEARAQRAAELRQMPIHVDLQWNEAQLGQLARLLIGSDPGWRGDLTGEVHVEGTAEAAQIKTRLRATGVHRAEFAPAAPMDFDASCGGTYHYPVGALDGLLCDSPLGDGRVRLTGKLPAGGKGPSISVELDRIPVAAGLDALRTVRSGIGPGLQAAGLVSGKISYAPVAAILTATPQPRIRLRAKAAAKASPVETGPLTGSLTVENFALSGGGLSTPIQAAKLVLEPVSLPAPSTGPLPVAAPGAKLPVGGVAAPLLPHAALAATMSVAAGGAAPLTVTARLSRRGYEISFKGQASLVRAQELARVAELPQADALNAVAGEAVSMDLTAAGPWMAAPVTPVAAQPAAAVASMADPALTLPHATAPGSDVADQIQGTVNLRNANWKAGFLANPVEIAQATLHLGAGGMVFDPVAFTYGPVKGTATVAVPAHCDALCTPSFQVRFGQLDAGVLQSALLGAHEPGTLLSTLIDRLRSTDKAAPAWPRMQGTVKADSFILGPVTLTGATAAVSIDSTGAAITALDAGLLGGQMQGAGTLSFDQGKPAYTFTGAVEKLNPAEVSRLVGLEGSGGSFKADGKIALSGFSGKDLPAVAQGTLHFDWVRGRLASAGPSAEVPAVLSRFDGWSGDAEVGSGAITVRNSDVQQGARKQAVDAKITLGETPKAVFTGPKSAPKSGLKSAPKSAPKPR